MYNHQLDTFIVVADSGSFNKAAEALFISPPAVIKQINLLEDSLGIRLFTRTHRGLQLTKAGQSVYEDARYIIAYCRESVERAKKADDTQPSVLRIGTSTMTPGQTIVDMWTQIREEIPDIKFQLVPFENTPENARAKWRYHSDKNKRLGRYTREDNLFSFIDDVDGMKALSHEIGHFLQEHLGFRQTFEDYRTPFAKKLLLLENDYTENDIFNMPQYIQNVLRKFCDHKSIETGEEYTPNLKQLSKKTCFQYFQLTARWRKSCEISNMLGVYFKVDTLYVNTLSDFHE